eukprot:GHVS01004369.1.p2 GENE.GHVS01004369.1~~GHVS01004369.1.p2  ORF type:complete len:182 (+),score=49.42 GHVS01004369.1:86-631(+)
MFCSSSFVYISTVQCYICLCNILALLDFSLRLHYYVLLLFVSKTFPTSTKEEHVSSALPSSPPPLGVSSSSSGNGTSFQTNTPLPPTHHTTASTAASNSSTDRTDNSWKNKDNSGLHWHANVYRHQNNHQDGEGGKRCSFEKSSLPFSRPSSSTRFFLLSFHLFVVVFSSSETLAKTLGGI